MDKLRFKYRGVICVILFTYQSWLDLLREGRIKQLSQYLEPIVGFESFNFLFLLFILHRSFIHGLILWVFSGKSKLLKYYMLLDSSLLLLLLATMGIAYTFSFSEDLIFLLRTILLRMVNTPVLLIFCLPAYYIINNKELFKSRPKD